MSMIRNWAPLDRKRAEQWLISLRGREAYKATWRPLLARKFPEAHQEISAAWVWHRVYRLASSRRTLFHRERLGSVAGGTQTLVDALEGRLIESGVTLHRGTPVSRIRVRDGVAVGLDTAERSRFDFDYVVSAVPLPTFLRLVQGYPAAARRRLSMIDFIGVVCVVLRLRRPLTKCFWLNINDSRIPFNGCIEYTNLNPAATPDGSAILYVPHYLPTDHPRFTAGDQDLLEESFASLRLIHGELERDDVLDFAVSREAYAQNLCRAGFSDLVPPHETPIEGLYLIESSQLYPADRSISGTLELADNVARAIGAREGVRSLAAPLGNAS
jgi:protoporphyrinogen oxidase